MRILLAQNSLYYPSHGGGDKSNRMLMEALAARGHACRAVARIPVFGAAEESRYLAELAARGVAPQPAAGALVFHRANVEVHVVTTAKLRSYFAAQAEDFRPDIILASTDDPAQVLLEAAFRAPSARTVYLARATIALPFGPDSAFPSATNAARIRSAARVVGVSEYVARYVREYGRMDATHVPISLLEPGRTARAGPLRQRVRHHGEPLRRQGHRHFPRPRGLFPNVAFAAVPLWGANQRDRAALAERPNIHVIDPVDDIDLLLARTRILLAPSLWAEARSRIVVEAMLRGVPVMAADVGGIPEAKMGVPYLLPVNPITGYRTQMDDRMNPVADVPPQDIAPWRDALARLLSDRPHYEEISRASRTAAQHYAAHLTIAPFEKLLQETPLPTEPRPSGSGPALPLPRTPPTPRHPPSQPRPRILLVSRRRRRPIHPPFLFPLRRRRHSRVAPWRRRLPAVCPVLLPARESRLAEAPFQRMPPLVDALTAAIRPYLDRPFAFFGHSMGAAVAFELARKLRLLGLPQPRLLIASAARAPQFRRNYTPPPAPSQPEFLAELRRLEGLPPEALDDPAILAAILPALTADAALYRNYVYAEDAPLACPIRAYGGSADPNIHSEHLEPWAAQTSASFAVRLFPGAHLPPRRCHPRSPHRRSGAIMNPSRRCSRPTRLCLPCGAGRSCVAIANDRAGEQPARRVPCRHADPLPNLRLPRPP